MQLCHAAEDAGGVAAVDTARTQARTHARDEGADDDRRCMFFCRFVSISLTSVTPFTEMWFNTIHSEVDGDKISPLLALNFLLHFSNKVC